MNRSFYGTLSLFLVATGLVSGCARALSGDNIFPIVDGLSGYPSPATAAVGATPDTTPPGVLSVTPADGATGLGTLTQIAITFDEAMDPATLTTNTADTVCSGVVRISADNFATCVQMSGAPAASSGNTIFTLTPVALSLSTLYKIRVTVAATDVAGNALSGQFESAIGFTTGTDSIAPGIFSTNPADAASGEAVAGTIEVTFDEAMNTATITTNTANSTCSGSFQVSMDNFSTCLQMGGAPVASGGDTIFTVTPAVGGRPAGTTFKIRITTAATDQASNPIAATFTHVTGFSTTGKRTFLSSATNSGLFLTAVNADSLCGTGDANHPDNGTYKAMIVDGITRRACTTANCGGGVGEHIDWVMAVSTEYYQSNGVTQIMTSDASGIFVFGTLTSGFAASGSNFWTGLNADWTGGTSCTLWTALVTGNVGNPTGTGTAAISNGAMSCLGSRPVLCVQQ